MKVKIKKESDKLYTVITVLMLLVFWFHYFFLVIDYYLILLIGLACMGHRTKCITMIGRKMA